LSSELGIHPWHMELLTNEDWRKIVKHFDELKREARRNR